MVMAVLRRPPQHAFLRRALRHRREHKLERSAGRIRPVGKVAMVPRADGEDASPIEDHADHDGLPGDAGPDSPETGEMCENEGDRRRIHDVFMGIVVFARNGFRIAHGIFFDGRPSRQPRRSNRHAKRTRHRRCTLNSEGVRPLPA